MFLGVIPAYEQQGIGTKLCEVAVELANGLKIGQYTDLLKPHVSNKRPKLVSALFTSRFSQTIGHKLKFKTMFEESYDKFVFNGKTYSSRIGPLHPTSLLVAKEI